MSDALRKDAPQQILKFPSPGDGEITVAQIVASYLTYKASEVRAGAYDQASYVSKDHYLNSFLTHIGGSTKAAQLTNSVMKRWIFSHPEWESSNTKLDAMGALCSCFNWAAFEAELVSRSPFRRSKGICPPPEPLPPLEEWEFRKILNTARDVGEHGSRKRPSAAAFRVGLFFLWESGARTKEMRIARIEWLDWPRRVLVIPAEFHKTGRKTGQPRLIPIGRKLGRLILRLCRGRETGLIFRNGRGGSWRCQTFADQFRNYARMAGIREAARPGTARHGYTVAALEAGATSKELADILGHTSTKQVDRVYGASTRFRAARLTESADKINAAKGLRKNRPT